MYPNPAPNEAGCLVRRVDAGGAEAMYVCRTWSNGMIYASPVLKQRADLPPPTLDQLAAHMGAHLASWACVIPLQKNA